MKVTLRAHREKVSPTVSLHLEHSILDFGEFNFNKAIIGREVGKSSDNVECFMLVTLEN
jgi:hypothetical protein